MTLSAPGLRPALIASASASGAVGSVLLAQLLAGPAYGEIHALVRRPVPVPPSADAGKLVQHVADVDAVVMVAHLGHRLGASRLAAVSALGADPSSRFLSKRIKCETEAQLIGLDPAIRRLMRSSDKRYDRRLPAIHGERTPPP